MCKNRKKCTKCQNKAKQMASVGNVKGKKKRVTRRRRARVGGFSTNINLEELALIGVGALGVKAIINPLGKAFWPKKDEANRPKFFPLITKGVLAVGLSQVKNKYADAAAKGAALAAVLEAAEMFAPKVFATSNIKMGGYDDELADNVELNLEDINGYGDEGAVAGYGEGDVSVGSPMEATGVM